MKKQILTIAMMATCAIASNAQQRLVLYEEFTGENCGPCAADNPGLETLMAANTSKVVHVTYMEPVPTSGYFYLSDQADNDTRSQYYFSSFQTLIGANSWFTPSGLRDGVFPDGALGYSGGEGIISTFTQTDIDSEYNVASPFNIVATRVFNAAKDSVTITAKVTAVSAYSGTLMLRCVWVKTMNFTAPPGNNGETHFENVVRKMFADQTIPASWTVGMSNTYTFKGKISHLDTFTNTTGVDSMGVVWIQNDANKRVAQVARANSAPTGVNEITNSDVNFNIHPNPAQNAAMVNFELNNEAQVQVSVFDALGREVSAVAAQKMAAGVQNIPVNTSGLASGIYYIKMNIDGNSITKPLSIVK